MVKEREKENVKMNMRKQGKVCDVTEQARKPVAAMHLDASSPNTFHVFFSGFCHSISHLTLWHAMQKKKMLGFISKCLS